MNEKQFEECDFLLHATHVEINGVRHELLDNVQYWFNGKHGIRLREEDVFIPEEVFSILGIKALRKKKLVFEHIFTLEEISLGIIPDEAEGKRFKCVEI